MADTAYAKKELLELIKIGENKSRVPRSSVFLVLNTTLQLVSIVVLLILNGPASALQPSSV